MENMTKLRSLVRESYDNNAGKFRPCVYFDDRLDCVRVLTRDCSIIETRVNQWITVLRDAHPKEHQSPVVGFTIKGARYFCKHAGMNVVAPIRLSEILNALMRLSPDPAVELFVTIVAKQILQDEKEINEFEVTLPPFPLTAAEPVPA